MFTVWRVWYQSLPPIEHIQKMKSFCGNVEIEFTHYFSRDSIVIVIINRRNKCSGVLSRGSITLRKKSEIFFLDGSSPFFFFTGKKSVLCRIIRKTFQSILNSFSGRSLNYYYYYYYYFRPFHQVSNIRLLLYLICLKIKALIGEKIIVISNLLIICRLQLRKFRHLCRNQCSRLHCVVKSGTNI